MMFSLSSAAQPGMISAQTMQDLFNGYLHVRLPGGSFQVNATSFSSRRVRVYENRLPLSFVIRLTCQGKIPALNQIHKPSPGIN
jgi:hypothetical protein